MKIICVMSDQDFREIEPHISCAGWSNPEEDLFIFWEPTLQFRLVLAMMGIESTVEE